MSYGCLVHCIYHTVNLCIIKNFLQRKLISKGTGNNAAVDALNCFVLKTAGDTDFTGLTSLCCSENPPSREITAQLCEMLQPLKCGGKLNVSFQIFPSALFSSTGGIDGRKFILVV